MPPRLVKRTHPFRLISCGINLGKGIDLPEKAQLHKYGQRRFRRLLCARCLRRVSRVRPAFRISSQFILCRTLYLFSSETSYVRALRDWNVLRSWRARLLIRTQTQVCIDFVRRRFGHLADGLLDVIIVNEDCKRFGTLRMFMHTILTSGNHVAKMSAVSHAKVRSTLAS